MSSPITRWPQKIGESWQLAQSSSSHSSASVDDSHARFVDRETAEFVSAWHQMSL